MLLSNLVALLTLASASSAELHHQHKRGDTPANVTSGITYTPYLDDGNCKTASQIATELATLSAYDNIRLYGVDCDQVAAVLAGKSKSQKLFLGIYYVDKISDSVSTIASAVEAHGSWDDVHTVSVGNELVNDGSATVAQIKEYVSSAKTALTAAGYSGYVVSVDTFVAVLNNLELCEISDYVAVNAHPYFDVTATADKAGEWVLGKTQELWAACGGKKQVVVTESGWPSEGQTNGLAVPSKSNQATAIASIVEHASNSTFSFTAFNDLWKADGYLGVEKYWGIYSK